MNSGRRLFIVIMLGAFILASSSCANLSVDQGLSLLKAARSTAAAVVPVSLEEEVQIGQAVAARVAGRYGVLDNASLTEYVNLVGLVCAANCGRPEVKYRFAVLKSDEINAFAAPGGYVFITLGAIKAMKNEAQMAGVLSHEIAHVARKHILKEIRKANLVSAGKSLAEASGKIPGGVLAAVSDQGANILFKGYSRNDEFDADAVGTDILYRSGYPADGLSSFLESLNTGPEKHGLEALTSTHPPMKDRLGKIRQNPHLEDSSSKNRPSLGNRFRKRTGAS